jgi:hypothetical protein
VRLAQENKYPGLDEAVSFLFTFALCCWISGLNIEAEVAVYEFGRRLRTEGVLMVL